MIIELMGATGAGKTTLAHRLRDHLGGPPEAVLATDLVLDRPGLRRIRNATAVNVVQDVRGLPHLLRALPRRADVLRLSAGVLARHAPSGFDLVMNARSVARRTGMFELARARAGARVVLVDEGPALIAYHLFVYSTVDLRAAPVDQFAAIVPLPDLLVYLRSPLPVLLERAVSRPDRRRQLKGLTQAEAEVPLRRAVDVFDRLVATPRLRERTLVVDNSSQDPEELDRIAARVAATVRRPGSGPGAITSGAVDSLRAALP